MDKKIAFIGVGNMAGAIILGITAENNPDAVSDNNICVFDVDRSKYDKYSGRRFVFADSPEDAIAFADYIVLAVKPQNYRELCTSVGAKIKDFSGKVFISLAAGVSTDAVCSVLGSDAAVVRTMPNTPLLVGAGVTALCRNRLVSNEDFAKIRSVFDSMGMTMVLDEKDMNKVIAVTGSSPAYVFSFIKALCDGASAQGLEYKELKESACRAVIGSATLLMNSDKTPEELISMVTSKGGTTEQAMLVLKKYSFEEAIVEAMEKCTERAETLGENL